MCYGILLGLGYQGLVMGMMVFISSIYVKHGVCPSVCMVVHLSVLGEGGGKYGRNLGQRGGGQSPYFEDQNGDRVKRSAEKGFNNN